MGDLSVNFYFFMEKIMFKSHLIKSNLRVPRKNKVDIFRAPEAGLLNKRLMLSSSSRCEQIYKYEIHDFGHTLLCYLSRT
jgi:hypothetical protein